MRFAKNRGFTLIELLIVIAIIGVLTGLITTNFLAARQRARDAAIKSDLRQLKTAFQLYYGDYNAYPDDAAGNTDIAGCGATGTNACGGPESTFQSGSTLYMKQLPASFTFYSDPAADTYVVKASLENASDEDLASSQARCNSSCPAASPNCCAGSQDFCVCPD